MKMFSTILLALLVTLALAAPAAGQPAPAEAPKAPADAAKAPADDTKAADAGAEDSMEDADPADEAPAPKKPSRRPYSTDEYLLEDISDIEIQKQQKMTPLRESYIAKTVSLLDSTPNHPMAADLHFRVAEYMTQNIEFQFSLQVQQYKKDLALFKAGTITDKPVLPPQDYSKTLPYYKKILREFGDYPKAEEVYYYLGRNGLETGKSLGKDKLLDESVGYLDKFTKLFPESKYRAKALFMLAEYHFNQNKLAEALNYYKDLVEKHPDAPMYDYAHYKLGWVYYNYQQYDQVLPIYQVVLQGQKDKGFQDGELYKQVLNDYVITVSEAGNGYTEAREFLIEQIGEERAYVELHRIAEIMGQKDFSEDAISLYQHFISLDPNARIVMDYWDNILGIARNSLSYEEAEDLIRQMNQFFRPDGPFYNKNTDAESRDRVHDLIVKWDLFAAAYFLEEAMFRGKDEDFYLRSITQFREILRADAGHRVEQAWAGIVLAYAGLLKDRSGGEIIWVAENVMGLAVPGNYALPKARKARSYNDSAQGLVDAYKEWLAVPDRKGQKPDLLAMRKMDMQAMIFHFSALIQYQYGHFADMLAAVDAHVSYDPRSDFLGQEVWMIADASTRAKDWAGLETRMKAMLAAENFKISPKAELLKHYCTGAIERGRVLSDEGRIADAMAKLAEAGAACVDDPDKAGEAYYRLGEVAEGAGQFGKARDAYGKVLSEFGKSRFKSMASRGAGRVRNK